MANTPIVPPYSFLQLADQADSACVVAVSGCLPLLDFSGLKFELFFNDYTPFACAGGGHDTVTIIYAFPTITPLPLGDIFPTYGTDILPRVINNNAVVTPATGYTTQTSMSTVDVTRFDVFNALVDPTFPPINPGDCFSFNIIIEGYDSETTEICAREVIGHTNCFYYAPDGCYLSIIKYSNRSNAFGFEYFNSGSTIFATNTVTLPLYLRKPQNPTSESSYKLSNGDFLKVYSITDQEWILETANIGADWHQKIAIMLGHDDISLYNEYANAIVPNLNGLSGYIPIVISEKYEADWQDTMPLVALCKGKAKVKNAVPISMINNNCS